MKRTNQILSLLLAIVMVVCMLPVSAFAAVDPTTNLCEHHTAHDTAVCDWAEAQPCTFVCETCANTPAPVAEAYTITYDANGGTGTVPVDNNVYASGDKVVYAEPTGLTGPDGKVFVYWATNPNGDTNIWYPGEETITQNMYLYAIWRNPQISVTYSANGANVSIPVDTNKYDTKENITVKAPVDTLTPGNEKIFIGWNTKADGSGTTYQAGDTFKLYWLEDVTLYAMWAETVTVTYNANGGTGTPPETAILAKGSSYVFAYPDGLIPPDGKVFYLWGESPNSGNNFHDTVNEGAVYEDMTLYAIWRNSQITVTYDANGEKVNVPTDSTKYGEKEPITVKAPIVTLTSGNEKIFTGWNTKADGSGTAYQAGDTFSLSWAEDVTLYAQWSEAVTVTYMANGGTGTPPEPDIVARGSNIVFASPDNLIPPDGKVFKWWGSAPNGGNNLYGIVNENTVYGDMILYAVWEDAPTPTSHSITVQTEGNGTASASPTAAVQGTKITLTATPDSGWYFKEWVVISGGIAVSSNEFTMPDDNVEIKAVFEETPPTSSSIQLYIVPESGETIILNLEPADSIENVKQQIQDRTGIAPAKQILVFNGKTLEDGRTLADYNIPNGDTLYLSLTADSYRIFVSASPAMGGTITGEGSYAPGEQVTITVTPDTAKGYCAAGWWLAAVGGQVVSPIDRVTSYTFTMPAKDVEISIAFVQHSYISHKNLGDGTHDVHCIYCGDIQTASEPCVDVHSGGDNETPNGWCDKCNTRIPGKSIVQFESNHESAIGEVYGQIVDTGSSITLPVNGFTLEGYTFQGWSAAADGSGALYQVRDTYSVTADTTLYAIWKSADPAPHTHSYGTLKYDADKHWYECSCGGKSSEAAHSGGTATCKDQAKCEVCNVAYGELSAHGETEVRDAKDATCTEEGYTGDKHCKVCGELLESGKDVAKTAHTYENGKCTVCKAADPNYKPNAPQTGDSSHAGLWLITMLVGGFGFAATVICGKKRRSY